MNTFLPTCFIVIGTIALSGPRESTASAEPLVSKPTSAASSLREKMGIDALTQRLGVNHTPTGRGVMVTHVESRTDGGYLPNSKQDRFQGVHFIPRSGGTGKISGHAHATAKIIYGPRGLAPGITEVQCYSSRHWMGEGCLRVQTNRAPVFDGSRIINCSWIARGQQALAVEILRRLDYLADIYNVIPVVGVDNGSDKTVPALLASGYNLIAVGRANGRSSGGETSIEEANRCKPDIVAPGSLTSFSVPAVSAAVARLLELAPPGSAAGASRAQVIKAVLLGGATKPPRWKAASGHPLDSHLGAGVVNVLQSCAMLVAGSPVDAMIRKKVGWVFSKATVRQPRSWYLQIRKPLHEVSILLTWHRRINGSRFSDRLTRKTVWSSQPRLADFDLALYDARGQIVAQSASDVDNVEHVYLRHLPPGSYELQVSRKDTLDESWEFAMAWLLK